MNSIVYDIGTILMILGSVVAIATIFYLRWETYKNKARNKYLSLKTMSYELQGESGMEIMNTPPHIYRPKVKSNIHVRQKQGVYVFEVNYGQPLYSCLK